MFGKIALAALAASTLAIAGPAFADTYDPLVDVRAESLSAALMDLAHQTGAELLFDRAIVSGIQCQRLHGKLSVEAALQRLLAASDLTMRRSTTGAWIIERHADHPGAVAEVLPIPDILVIGTRTQDVDIRRRENDVQPYNVETGQTVVDAHRDNLEQFFDRRITSDTQAVPSSLLETGATNSEIDIRGLGPNETLVLVDGRRMPNIPGLYSDFSQPDLNGIPLHAIERVETLTGTAGGIYGFGALGGVVNVVLKRDYRGVELHSTMGITSRGDAGRLSLEGRVGFTPDGGNTDVMVYLSHTASRPLLAGSRDYFAQERQTAAKLQPDEVQGDYPNGNAVNVFNYDGSDNLVFKQAYGGASLGANHTFLPTGFAGTPADLVSALSQRAGQTNLDLTAGDAASYLGSNPTVTSAIVNIRHRFGTNIEAYFDALILRDHGEFIRHPGSGAQNLAADAPENPFQQDILVTFPVPQDADRYTSRFDTSRYTGGVIVSLPFAWKATAEATFGLQVTDYEDDDIGLYTGQLLGTAPGFNPLGNWSQLQQDAAGYRADIVTSSHAVNHYSEQSLRLAGPLFRTAGGPASLTLLFEHRRESVPGYDQVEYDNLFGPEQMAIPVAARSTATTSFYGEFRTRLFPEDAPLPLLRNLELQLAVRHDFERFIFSSVPGGTDPDDFMDKGFAATAFTAGAKVAPLPWLMLRGSYATGHEPPPTPDLVRIDEIEDISILQDPKRGGQYLALLGGNPPFRELRQGSPNLTTVRASTLSLGIVLNPSEKAWPRISLDYSRIRRTHDVSIITDDEVLAHEDELPGRVIRAPLTDADRALGYTGGVITMIDASAMNAGSLLVESIDGRADWSRPFLGGTVHVYAAATLELRNVQRQLYESTEEQVGYYIGPLRWRANGGIDWMRDRLAIGANLQYFDAYSVFTYGDDARTNPTTAAAQGATAIPARTNLDLHASRRFRAPGGADVTVDLGIDNVFDTPAPRDGTKLDVGLLFGPGYALREADPRGRRFELVLSAGF
jgi:outer membrane receptor protein involved in Fe transport